MTVTGRRASTVFNRFNATIIDVLDLTDPTPTNYTAEDYFTFFDIIFAINQSEPYWPVTTQYMFLLGIQSYLGDPTATQNGTGADDRLVRLQEFLTTPVFLFNNGVYGGPSPGLGKTATLATPSYRVLTNSLIVLINLVGYRPVYFILLFRWEFHLVSLVFRCVNNGNVHSNSKHIIIPRNRHRLKNPNRTLLITRNLLTRRHPTIRCPTSLTPK